MQTRNKKVIIGTRGSMLAMWQANWIKAELQSRYHEIDVELKKIKTTGDKILDVPLAKVGGKGLFVKEIEEAMLRKEIDLAVHSMKDVPAVLPADLHLGAICIREDPRDALISKVRNLPAGRQGSKFEIRNFKDLPQGATVGTSSLRRMCQLLSARPDLNIVQLRGNLDTRIRKLDEGQFDAIIVAAAGVKRLGMAERITEILNPDISVPAIGQGAVGIESRIQDEFINDLIKPLNHLETEICVRAERAFNKKLEGGCQVPLAAYAQLKPEDKKIRNSEVKKSSTSQHHNFSASQFPGFILVIDGLVGSLKGDRIIRSSIKGRPEDAEKLGTELAEDLLSQGAKEILAEIFNEQ
ncbi:hydroxymethylbilane synthase [bacterium]|nr:MAG: hydroxymethylbilane synthase [bacterium]